MSPWKGGAAAGVAVVAATAAALLSGAMHPGRYASLLDPQVLLSRERRLVHFFGDCEPAGYGYLRRVLAAYSRVEPDPRKRPSIRYRDYNHRTEYLFEPTPFHADPDVIVGIGLTDADLVEREMSRGVRGGDGAWRFAVESHFDLLTRIDVEIGSPAPSGLELRLYRTERDTTAVWAAAISFDATPSAVAPEGRIVQVAARPPLGGFRSGVVDPFVIRAEENLSIRGMTAYGTVVDMEGFRVVHRSGACFAAIRDEQHAHWAEMIAALRASNDG